MRRAIITGDDFGRSHAVNEAVERLHRAGFLTQASLMVGGCAVDEAVRIARANPRLRVGLHLVACGERPGWNGLRWAFSRPAREGMARRVRDQFAAFAALGLGASYFDGHFHLHLHPAVFDVALGEARGFRACRLVREAGWGGVLPPVFRALSRRAAPRLAAAGIAAADRTWGLSRSGRLTTGLLESYLAACGEGWTEIYLHPGAEAGEIDGARLAARAAELGVELGAADQIAPAVSGGATSNVGLISD
jgi:predicted glycoside hydrolase/deacetylase ChbG (UPF0249 family)